MDITEWKPSLPKGTDEHSEHQGSKLAVHQAWLFPDA